MQVCKVCNTPMVGVMSFSKDKRERFCQCPKCYGETKHNLLRDNELDFREVLYKEYQEQKSKKQINRKR